MHIHYTSIVIFLSSSPFVVCTTSEQSVFGEHYILFPDEEGTMQYVNLTVPQDSLRSDFLEDPTYELYTRKNPNNPEQLFINLNLNQASRPQGYDTNYMCDKPVVMVTHGWKGSGAGKACKSIKDALLKTYDLNVITIDWSIIANNSYILTARHVDYVGRKTASMVRTLVLQNSLKSSMVHLVGHSLGAHVMGRAGFALRGWEFTVSRITGLDPARPLFEFPRLVPGLTSGDAEFVDIIHTNAGWMGVIDAIGHADFYPNGGTYQPGCEFDPLSCNHARSYMYFAESIQQHTCFESWNCNSVFEFLRGLCYNNDVQFMGYPCLKDARDNYYLIIDSTHKCKQVNKT